MQANEYIQCTFDDDGGCYTNDEFIEKYKTTTTTTVAPTSAASTSAATVEVCTEDAVTGKESYRSAKVLQKWSQHHLSGPFTPGPLGKLVQV